MWNDLQKRNNVKNQVKKARFFCRALVDWKVTFNSTNNYFALVDVAKQGLFPVFSSFANIRA
jgi:hypothetical protein